MRIFTESSRSYWTEGPSTGPAGARRSSIRGFCGTWFAMVLANELIDSGKEVDAEDEIRRLAAEVVIMEPVEHDGAGNMIRKGDVCYHYSTSGMLVRVGIVRDATIQNPCEDPDNMSELMRFTQRGQAATKRPRGTYKVLPEVGKTLLPRY